MGKFEGPALPDGGNKHVSDSGMEDVLVPDTILPVCRNGSGRNAVLLQRQVTRPFAWFGLPVAAEDHTIVVGAPIEREASTEMSPLDGTCGSPKLNAVQGAGTVRVFEEGAGQWTETTLPLAGIEQAKPIISTELIPWAGRIGVYQSTALAISGDWIAVGMAGDGDQSDDYRGSVRLFHREVGGWTALPDPLVAPNGRAGDLFGASLALAGHTLIVGAPGEDAIGSCDTDCGAVYAYALGADGPGSPNKIVSQSPADHGWFGLSVGASSDFIVTSAPLEQNGAGVVYVYDSSGTPAYAVTPEPGQAFYFGLSLSVRGNELAVGVPAATSSKNIAVAGLVALYRLAPSDDAGPGATLQWTFDNPDPAGVYFAASVALGARGLVVGAPIARPSAVASDGGIDKMPIGPGSAYVFERNDSGDLLPEPCQLMPPKTSSCDTFGDWVAATDTYFVVGAPRSDVVDKTMGNGAIANAGAAYVYALPNR